MSDKYEFDFANDQPFEVNKKEAAASGFRWKPVQKSVSNPLPITSEKPKR